MKRLAPCVAGLTVLVSTSCRHPGDGISRERAGELVVEQLVVDGDPMIVFSHPEPLTPASSVQVGSPERHGARATVVIPSEAWFFWIDDEPGARFDHPTRYVLVDRRSGELTVHDAKWWPILDGAPLWVAADAYWDPDAWAYASEAGRRGSLAGSAPSSGGACQPGFGTALVYNGFEAGQSGEDDFAFDAANMGETLAGLGFDVTQGTPTGAGAGEVDAAGLDAWFTQKAQELGPGDNLVVYITGHGISVTEKFVGTLGHGEAGGIYSADLAKQLAKFDPGVEIIVIVDACHSESMLMDLECVADLGLSAARSDQSSYGDLDDRLLNLFGGGDDDPDDQGGEFTSALARSMREIVADPGEFARLETVAQQRGGSFMGALVAEATLRERTYDLAYQRGWSEAQLRDGAVKTRPTVGDPTPPACAPGPGDTDTDSETDGSGTGDTDTPVACDDVDLQHIAAVLGDALGVDVTDAVCSDGEALPAGNSTQHSNGKATSAATEEVDWVHRGSILGVDLPGDVPCGESDGAAVLCAAKTLPITGNVAIFYGRVAAPIDLDGLQFDHQYGFVFDTDGDAGNDYVPGPQYPADFFAGTDLWLYTVHVAGEGWTTWAASAATGFANVASSERIVIAGDIVALVVDEDEIHGDAASWRMTAFRHLGDYGASMPWSGDVVPPVGEPLSPLP